MSKKSTNHAKVINAGSENYEEPESSEGDSYDLCFESFVHLPKLNSTEAELLQLVASGHIESVQRHLQKHPTLNINCINFQGISALHVAVRTRSEKMVEFLLNQPHIEIGDNVLHAVQNNSIKILVMLLEAQKKVSPGLEFAGSTHSTNFPEHVTPLILAAQSGHYEIISLLISRGHTIIRPHPPNCPSINRKTSQLNEDPLHASIARLSAYRAISSSAYMIHTSADPILTAFKLTAELETNAAAYRQLAAAYLQLRNDVSAFAVDLIGCCRTSQEVELILKQTSGSHGHQHFILPRLLLAVNYRQKEFVAHPKTQEVLESYWLGDWYSWKYKSSITKALIFLKRVFIIPIILILGMVAPRCWLVRHWQIPLNKLITHAAAYFVFLTLVFYISNQDKTEQKRGPPNTGAEGPLILYVCGYTWSAIRMCLMRGPRRYFSDMWNLAEIIMLALFVLTFAFWISAAIQVTNTDYNIERKYWNQHDPTLLAEGTFCLATIFAYFRLMLLCQLNYHLGPLQVCLGKMTIDIYKYVIVFTIIISSFAAGLARLYQYYDGMVYEDKFGVKTVQSATRMCLMRGPRRYFSDMWNLAEVIMLALFILTFAFWISAAIQVSSFTTLPNTLKTLFWALFCMAPLESADVVLANTRNTENNEKNLDSRHEYTELIGYFCFGCFEVISVIVVLNMLIATMSNTFQRVTDNVAIEWTFGRTEVYLNYMSQTMLPPPLNMVPTAAGMSSAVEWLRTKIYKPLGHRARCSAAHCFYMERDIEADVQKEFPALMSVLVQRYFSEKQSSTDKNNDNCAEELVSIRRELASMKLLLDKLAKD